MTTRTLTLTDAARSGSELPTAQRLVKAPSIRVTEAQDGTRAVWVGDDSPIGRMALDGRISPRQYEAGKLFRTMDFRAHGPDISAASMEPSIRGGSSDHSERVIAARQQLILIRASLGEKLHAVLIAVCAKEESPSGWARARHMHPSIGAFALDTALTMLADRLGLQDD
jgi:hypothetical protein